MSGQTLAFFEDASAGKRVVQDEIQDYIRTTWHQIPWDKLILPPTLVIAALCRLKLITRVTELKLAPDENGRFQHIKDRDFRATVVQVVNAASLAFSQVYTDIDALTKQSLQWRFSVSDVIDLAMEKDMEGMSAEQRSRTIARNILCTHP